MSMTSDRALQEAYGRLLESQSRRDRDDCAEPEAILAVVERTGGEESRLETLDHVMSCSACRGEMELLQAISRSASGEGAPPVPSRPWFNRSGWAWAASLTLMFGAGSVLWSLRNPDPDGVMRGVDTRIDLIAPDAGAALGEGTNLLWHSLPEGFEYTVELFNEEGDLVFSQSTSDTILTLVGDLPAGKDATRWWVTARTGNGTVVTSEIRSLRPPSR